MNNMREATCGDCIHAEFCENNTLLSEFSRDDVAYCQSFKDRHKLVEVVRCNDCVWFDDEGYENHDPEMPELRMGFCKIWRRDTQACRFCSMGDCENEQRKDTGSDQMA